MASRDAGVVHSDPAEVLGSSGSLAIRKPRRSPKLHLDVWHYYQTPAEVEDAIIARIDSARGDS